MILTQGDFGNSKKITGGVFFVFFVCFFVLCGKKKVTEVTDDDSFDLSKQQKSGY